MKVVEFNFERTIKASYDAVMWNYWDHEHLYIVHEDYTNAKVFFEDKKLAATFLDFKIPIFSFLTSRSLNIMYLQNANTIKVFNIGFLNMVSETTIHIQELSKDNCKLTMNYKFYLKGLQKILSPFLERMVSKWNEKVWEEDYNLKIRRTKLLNLGFQDYKGIVKKDIKAKKFSIPIKRHPFSPVNLKKTKNK